MTTDRTFGRIAVDDVIVSDRVRTDFGDIDELAESMAELGQLQPIVITPARKLIAGERRLRAAKQLGWEWIDCRVSHNLDDSARMLTAEAAENTCRKPFTPAERIDLARRLQPILSDQARLRQLREAPSGGRVRDLIGKAVGWSGRTVEKALQIVDAAEDETLPIEVRNVAVRSLEHMLATGLVDPGYMRLRRAIDKSNGVVAPVQDSRWARRRIVEALGLAGDDTDEARAAAVYALIAGPDGAQVTKAIRARRTL